MGRQTFKQLIKDIIAGTSWKIFLWAIGMTADEYWNEAYKQERNRRCIDSPPVNYPVVPKEEKIPQECNELLRSAYSIACRDGKDTNWEAFRGRLKCELDREHAIMHKETIKSCTGT